MRFLALLGVLWMACGAQAQPRRAPQKKNTAPAAAAAPTPPVTGSFPLETLTVEGNKRIPADKILALTGLKLGRGVSKDAFDDARAALLKTGAFQSVGYEFGPSEARTGYAGVFRVVEVAQLYPFRFEDLPSPDEAIRSALNKQESLLGDQIPATREVVSRYERAIEEFLGGKVKVTGALNNDVPGQLAVVFRSAAPRSNIAEVHFTGNEIVPTSLLVNTLADVAVGVPFSETPVRVLLDSSIRPLYEARGLLRVTFPRITTEKATKVEGVSVTVAVNEGPIYALGTVQFTGAAAAKAKTLLDDADWKKGEPVNFDQIKASLDKIEAGFRREGYLRVSSRVDRNIHDREHSVDLSVAVDPGPQYTLGKLEIIGLDLNSEPAIRKMWTIGPGNPFDPAYPDEFLKRVRNEDLFDNLGTTRAETQVNEDSKTVDVKLYFPGAAAEAADKQKRTRIPQ